MLSLFQLISKLLNKQQESDFNKKDGKSYAMSGEIKEDVS